MEQAENYIDLASTIGANGINYYIENPGEMANLITRLNLDFPRRWRRAKYRPS